MAREEISYEITEELGVISTSKSGWTREVNMVSWNGRPAKMDIRDWAPGHERMGKGLTLTADEARELRDILDDIVLDKEEN